MQNFSQDESWQKNYNENGPVALTLHANVSVSVGGTVQLPCRIKNLGEYTVRCCPSVADGLDPVDTNTCV